VHVSFSFVIWLLFIWDFVFRVFFLVRVLAVLEEFEDAVSAHAGL
jgi:hypothetical protein